MNIPMLINEECRNLEAVILGGGFGTRLSHVVSDRQKILAEVNGRPFIFYLLDQLCEVGIRLVTLCTGYKGACVKNTIGEKYRELTIQYCHEEEPLGTGGALGNATAMICNDLIMVMNGDSYVDLDLKKLLKYHQKTRARVSIVITPVDATERYGSVEVDQNGEVVAFFEKKASSIVGSTYINAGIYLIEKSVLEELPAGQKLSLESEVLPTLIGKRFFAYKAAGNFIDIGTPESYEMAGRALNLFGVTQGSTRAKTVVNPQ